VVEAPEGLPWARADANQLEMAILNLSVNARDAMAEGGLLRIAASAATDAECPSQTLAPGPYLRLSVADTGAGMDQETLARAVEPFFSTKGVGQGTGLGLSMVHGLASQLQGALTIASSPGAGTTVELWLPQAEATPEPLTPPPDLRVRRASGTALIVDDEPFVRASTADMLAELGYRVIEAASAEEALGLIDGPGEFALVVTDHLMPGMTGADLARAVRDRRRTPVLVISGYAEAEGIAADLPRLTKPFRQDELAAAIAAL
jgi:CheY-like chemotaxis protein